MARMWKATTQKVSRNPENLEILVDILYESNDGQSFVEKNWTLGIISVIPQDMTLAAVIKARIGEHARRRIKNVLAVGDTMIDNVPLGVIQLPPDPPPANAPDPQLVADATAKLAKYQDARERALVSPNVEDKQAALTALDEFLAAKAAVEPSTG